MKKKLLIISTLALMLSITACNTDNADNTPNETEDNQVKDNQDNVDVEDNNNDIKEDLEDVGEDIKDKVDNITMTDDEMIEQSDQITKVKMIEKGKNEFELKILENLKGDLSREDIPDTSNLEKHRAYLIFTKVEDGKIVPTNGDKSYILLEGDKHEIFEKINKNKN